MRVKIMQGDKVIGTIPRPNCAAREFYSFELESPDDKLLGDHRSPMAAGPARIMMQAKPYVIENGWAQEYRFVADRTMHPDDFLALRGFVVEDGWYEIYGRAP